MIGLSVLSLGFIGGASVKQPQVYGAMEATLRSSVEVTLTVENMDVAFRLQAPVSIDDSLEAAGLPGHIETQTVKGFIVNVS